MKNSQVIIIGGGLAGLTAAIHLSRLDIQVILFEKEKYPHHKVCGEYLSKEVIPYLEFLGIEISSLKPATIDRLHFSTKEGKITSHELEMGGLGISRNTLDHYLFQQAKTANCEIIQDAVLNVNFQDDRFEVETASSGKFIADFVLGAFGKRSTLDKSLTREFISNKSGWLGIKAHYKNAAYPKDLVSLHNFNGGYCGLSATETGAINVCYLASYDSFKKYKDPEIFKNEVLMKNPKLAEFFSNSEMLFENELSIAQVNFDKKEQVHQHILMLGDAAGLIHPLCGNGMAMAIHSGKIASEILLEYFQKKQTDRREVENEYQNEWNRQFKHRMRTGRILQKILLNEGLAELSQNIISKFPILMPQIIKRTHGEPIHV
ncbi:NAD(P)/FAD-dependent oxidoreductase [Gramella sp. BOM4]|nr:NAD(P)/FAD-dependent oxidoreductase [Christiangramia bathymodioli]